MDLLPRPSGDIFDNQKVSSAFIEAVRSLSKLESVVDFLPNIDIFIESIPLQESRLSCSIENIVTSQDEVFRAFSVGEGQSDANIRDVLGYRKAIDEAQGSPITVETIEHVCSILKRKPMKIRSRSEDTVFLKTPKGEIVSTPPSGDKVPGLLRDLLEYLDDPDDDPLLKMAVFHAHFEIIHPFKDGNGRTGRILNEVLMQKFGLLSRPVLNLSRFLTDNRRDYYRFLKKVERDGSWAGYLFFMFSGVKQSADHTYLLIKQIRDSMQSAHVKCAEAGLPREVVDQIYSHPYIRAKHLVDAGIVSRNTASSYLSKLEKIGVLSGEQAGKGKIYMNVELFRILSQ